MMILKRIYGAGQEMILPRSQIGIEDPDQKNENTSSSNFQILKTTFLTSFLDPRLILIPGNLFFRNRNLSVKTTAVITTKWPGPTCVEDNPGVLVCVWHYWRVICTVSTLSWWSASSSVEGFFLGENTARACIILQITDLRQSRLWMP